MINSDRGVLVSFEGIDASGKNTQSKMLCDTLKENGLDFEFLSFPVYTTPIGQEIRNYLQRRTEYGIETLHTIYSANRYEFKSQIDRWVSEKKIVVLNRYCESNVAYGTAEGLPMTWLQNLESRMPQADHVFYLKITPELSSMRKTSRDRFEGDLKFLKRVSQVYDAMAADPKWITLDAERDVEIIHYEITRTLSVLLNGTAKKLLEDKSASESSGIAEKRNPVV